jgi:hypothetical protein
MPVAAAWMASTTSSRSRFAIRLSSFAVMRFIPPRTLFAIS